MATSTWQMHRESSSSFLDETTKEREREGGREGGSEGESASRTVKEFILRLQK